MERDAAHSAEKYHHIHKSEGTEFMLHKLLRFAFPCYWVLDCVVIIKLSHCEVNANVEERKKRKKKRNTQLWRIIKKSTSQKSQDNGKRSGWGQGNMKWNWEDPYSLCPSFTLHLSQQWNGLVIFQKEDPRWQRTEEREVSFTCILVPGAWGALTKCRGRRTDLQFWENGRSCVDSGVCDGFHQLQRWVNTSMCKNKNQSTKRVGKIFSIIVS